MEAVKLAGASNRSPSLHGSADFPGGSAEFAANAATTPAELAAQAGYLFARRFAGSGLRVFRRRAVTILTPDAAFLPGGLQGPFGERACGLLGLELFLELGELLLV